MLLGETSFQYKDIIRERPKISRRISEIIELSPQSKILTKGKRDKNEGSESLASA